MRILLVGHGRMGRMVESLAPEYGCEVAGIVDRQSPRARRWPDADAGGASTSRSISRIPKPCRVNVPALAGSASTSSIGTTGWSSARSGDRQAVDGRRRHRRRRRAELLDRRRAVRGARGAGRGAVRARSDEFGAWLHEAHHAMKKDAPSGTALLAEARDGSRPATRGRSTCRRRAPDTFPGRTRSVSTARPNRLRCRTRRAIAARSPAARSWRRAGCRASAAGSRCTMCSALSSGSADGGGATVEGISHEDAIDRRRHGARHAVHQDRRPRRAGRPAARPPADRRRHPLPRAVRHDRREPDADARRAHAHRRDPRGRSARQVPVLAGAGGYNTREVIHLADEMRKAGASGLLSVTPYYNKPTQEGLTSTSAPSPTARRCRSSSTTCRAAPASTSSRRRSRGSRRFRTSSA